MNLTLSKSKVFKETLIEHFDVDTLLTLENCADYIRELVNSGYIMTTSAISSDSDKDNRTTFSGHEYYKDFNDFLKAITSEGMKSESGVSIIFRGSIDETEISMSFIIGTTYITVYTPQKKP
jgi:hypothetical protein